MPKRRNKLRASARVVSRPPEVVSINDRTDNMVEEVNTDTQGIHTVQQNTVITPNDRNIMTKDMEGSIMVWNLCINKFWDLTNEDYKTLHNLYELFNGKWKDSENLIDKLIDKLGKYIEKTSELLKKVTVLKTKLMNTYFEYLKLYREENEAIEKAISANRTKMQDYFKLDKMRTVVWESFRYLFDLDDPGNKVELSKFRSNLMEYRRMILGTDGINLKDEETSVTDIRTLDIVADWNKDNITQGFENINWEEVEESSQEFVTLNNAISFVLPEFTTCEYLEFEIVNKVLTRVIVEPKKKREETTVDDEWRLLQLMRAEVMKIKNDYANLRLELDKIKKSNQSNSKYVSNAVNMDTASAISISQDEQEDRNSTELAPGINVVKKMENMLNEDYSTKVSNIVKSFSETTTAETKTSNSKMPELKLKLPVAFCLSGPKTEENYLDLDSRMQPNFKFRKKHQIKVSSKEFSKNANFCKQKKKNKKEKKNKWKKTRKKKTLKQKMIKKLELKKSWTVSQCLFSRKSSYPTSLIRLFIKNSYYGQLPWIINTKKKFLRDKCNVHKEIMEYGNMELKDSHFPMSWMCLMRLITSRVKPKRMALDCSSDSSLEKLKVKLKGNVKT